MERKHNHILVPYARDLRKNMTKEERRLWYDFLRNYSVRFFRQKVIGRYILDFYCAKAKIAVELDGSQHFEKRALQNDAKRTAFLEQYGISVIRIPNNMVVQNFAGVCEYIDRVTMQRLPCARGAGTAQP